MKSFVKCVVDTKDAADEQAQPNGLYRFLISVFSLSSDEPSTHSGPEGSTDGMSLEHSSQLKERESSNASRTEAASNSEMDDESEIEAEANSTGTSCQ